MEYSGLVILNKPAGCSSHKMVGLARRIFGMKKIGHTGTLDPAATGVLPLLLGKATRAAELLTAENKRYTAEVLLGTVTDTLDLDGQVLCEKPVTVTEDEVRRAVSGFVGEIEQLPPMYSAISVGGRRLYDLARQGVEVEREKRRIVIHSIDILSIELPKITIDVRCSKGTYIRTLGADIGEALGCGGCVSSLCRTESGELKIENALTPEELEHIAAEGRLSEIVTPIDKMFAHLPEIRLDERRSHLVKNGVPAYFNKFPEGDMFRVYDSGGEFIALSVRAEADGRSCLKTVKAFY
ncbi:MAG: tRNA pseudouridine(55) synthase TruB [Oscillospiraceae bacterium]|nr:tRNA pseudouridine(55) synthase TruB [Oscillospiraceae bacterium]